ncbi:MAG TPA: glycoside hydrolase family 3 N-terminal domain-containing protein [Cryomorphaceae bacterium]|nr:glycoside hydrolase family 3 N-terminal domain-containing protein [Cryomorphaceae bacterium]
MENSLAKQLTIIFSILSFHLCACQKGGGISELFFSQDYQLDKMVQDQFDSMDEKSRVAQMIITSAGDLGKSDKTVYQLALDNRIGGVVFLKGTKDHHFVMIDSLNDISNLKGQPRLIFSIDAEPSLFNSRLSGFDPVMNTIDIKSEEASDSIAALISNHLLEVGFHHNFAPVCDLSPQNEAIKNRSFGNDRDQVAALCKAFIESTQRKGVVATAKHFPGHGLVKGDTHKKSVYIDGELKELDVYPPLIDAGVLSIMVAHITVLDNEKYGTDGLPASCSRVIVHDLLKEELGYEGIIVTDALNIMKAVTIIDNAPLLASKAGCDMLLMPLDEKATIESILREMTLDSDYQKQVYDSVKKILRLKIVLGLIG